MQAIVFDPFDSFPQTRTWDSQSTKTGSQKPDARVQRLPRFSSCENQNANVAACGVVPPLHKQDSSRFAGQHAAGSLVERQLSIRLSAQSNLSQGIRGRTSRHSPRKSLHRELWGEPRALSLQIKTPEHAALLRKEGHGRYRWK